MHDDGDSVKVLLCEDEPLILMTTADMLQAAGMTVVEAGSAQEALKRLSSRVIDILVTDIGLPDMSGFELAIAARNAHPELPVVFATGDRHVEGSDTLRNVAILGKPYSDPEIIGAINDLLREKRRM